MSCGFANQDPAMAQPTEKSVAAELLGYCPHIDSEKSNGVTSQDALPVVPSPDLYCLAQDYNPQHIQKVVKEAILLAGGAVAILLQVAHPGVAAGVNNNSNFAYRVMDRLRTTMTYVYCMAYGTPKERATIIEMVHRAHIPVKGPGYTADDPHLQLWVAATLYAAGVDIWEKIFGKLDDVAAEKLFQEYSVIACSLRVPREMWPKSRADFWVYWDEKIETLVIDDNAKSVAKDLLYNKNGPLWIRSALPFVRILTAEWMPPRMRAPYGLKISKTRHMFYSASMGYVKVVYPHMPLFVREYPLRYYLKDMRKRMKKLEKA
jgi:uncharacterized protein (DUF2236 family)